jgi:acyl transferase domain-containing protein/acyl carrier protein
LEVGPGQTLSTLARYSLPASLILSSLPTLHNCANTHALILTTLGRLWLAGSVISWSKLYPQQRQRLSLPTYPFERERFWIEPPGPSVNITIQENVRKVTAKSELKDWFYLPVWRQSIAPHAIAKRRMEESCWLIFDDSSGFSAQLGSSLHQYGGDVIYVQRGEHFMKVAEDVYRMNPQRPEDYQALLEALCVQDKFPMHIIHAWLVSPPAYQTVAERLTDSLMCGYYSLLYLAQAIDHQGKDTSLKIYLLTHSMQAIAGEEVLCPEQAPALGPCKVFPQEYSSISYKHIDVVVPHENWARQRMVEQVLNEVLSDSVETAIAYRQNQRWVHFFERLKIADKPDRPIMLRQRGVYLVIGGLGAIGLLFAEYLSQTVQADLILLGRSPFPGRAAWDEWLVQHEITEDTSRKINRLRVIEGSGSNILLVQADVSDAAQMERALAEAYSCFGHVNGVIHAAGGIADKSLVVPFNQLDEIISERHFQAKITGLLVLEKILEGKKLDFCLFQSSLSSILGGLGFVAYAAANLFIDAYVQAHNRLSPVPWLAVNWDSWQLRDDAEAMPSRFGSANITAEEGIQAFAHLFSGDIEQIVVSTYPLKEKLAQWINPGEALEAKKQKEKSQTSYSRPSLQNMFVLPRTETELRLAEIWKECLGLDAIGVLDDFFELGGDSLIEIQLISQVHQVFSIDLPLSVLFEAATIEGMASLIEKESLQANIGQLSEENVDAASA